MSEDDVQGVSVQHAITDELTMLSILSDLNTVASFASIGGLAATVAQWYQQWRSEVKAAKHEDAKATIGDYLEWLRRENHREIIEQVQLCVEVQQQIARLIEELNQQSGKSLHAILEELHSIDRNLCKKIDDVTEGIEDLKRRIQLFPPLATSLGESYTRFQQTYLEKLAQSLNRLSVLGVSEMRQVKQSLDIAYVSLNVKTDRPDEEEPERAEEVLLENRLLIVRGPAGSGKSTLLNWVMLQCASQIADGNPWYGGIPFCIPLRRLSSEEGRPVLSKFVQYTLDPTLFADDAPAGWLTAVLDSRRAVVLLDGVDELPGPLRPPFWEWVGEFTASYPGNRVYITSRGFPEPDDSNGQRLWNPPSEFPVADLDEMNDADVRTFIVNWHNAIIAQTADEQECRQLEQARDALPDRLAEPANRRVRDLCRTPLLCALVCVLHWREEGYLPSQRVRLYDRCCAMLIEERDEKRKISVPTGPIQFLTLDDKEMILQQLALHMMRNKCGVSGRNQQIEISREEAISWVKPSLPNCQNVEARKCNASQVINYLVERTGLLREPARGRIDFAHRTFQEYLAACAAGAENQAGDLAQHAFDDQWHETIVLAAGTKVGGVPFGNALVTSLLDRGEAETEKRHLRHSYFALAVACLETGRQISDALRARVIKHLNEILPPRDKNHARSLSAAGEYVLPFLKYGRWRSSGARILAACARTIALIGGTKARAMLLDVNGFGREKRATILSEICECADLNPLEIPGIATMLQEKGLPKTIAPLITDLSAIQRVPDVHYLNLSHCENITDLGPLANLPNLAGLFVAHCPNVTSLRALAEATALRRLYVHYCPGITDIQPLGNCTGLTRLRLMHCSGVSDFRALMPLNRLEYLDLDGSRIADLSCLCGLNIRTLDLTDCNEVTDLGPLRNLSELRDLILRRCTAITDLTPLLDIPKLAHILVSESLREMVPKNLAAKANYLRW